MGNLENDGDRSSAAGRSGEDKLRGDALAGAEQKRAADHASFQTTRNPDRTLRVDGEKDTLYKDGLEVQDDDSPPMGTSGGTSGG